MSQRAYQWFVALAMLGSATAADAAGIPTINDETSVRPTCLDHYRSGARTNGFYLIAPRPGSPIVVYCLQNARYRGQTGGWTLVLSNLSGIPDKPFNDLRYTTSINTRPIYDGAYEHTAKPLLTDFLVFTGLQTWKDVATARGARGEILYRWSAGQFTSGPGATRATACPFQLDPDLSWRITFAPRSDCAVLVGAGGLPSNGFFVVHDGAKWSAIDADNDQDPGNCAKFYKVPFWHTSCWSGAITGYGNSEFHGAHWISAEKQYADPTTSLGSGDGWMFVR